MPFRAYSVIFAEAVVVGFFALLAYTGYEVLVILEGEYLVSLTWIPIQLTQSVIPIGATLFVICELLSFPDYYKKTCAGISLEHAEIEEEVETELAKAGVKS
jgi:TRAP-type C4-dicarboxylate transport system permease small subunit